MVFNINFYYPDRIEEIYSPKSSFLVNNKYNYSKINYHIK